MKLSIAAACLFLFAAGLQAAELKFAKIFSDHLVLQRDKPVAVWGWADAQEKITVEFAGQKKEATTDADGRWTVLLDAMAASEEPRELIVQSQNEGRKAKVADVLVGEVWLGSGQSNMALTTERARDFDAEKAAATLPLIRMFHEASPGAMSSQRDASGEWAVCSPETVGRFSAALYFFGRELHRELHVPVGLINSSVGGTPIQSWISAEAQMKVPELKDSIPADSKFDEAKEKANYEKALARWNEQAAKARTAGKAPPPKPRDAVLTRKQRGGIGGLFNGKIAPLIPYTMRGAIWYQGEANAHEGASSLYQFQLPALVNDWRARWGEDFPFAWVQLPNLKRDGDDWSLVREAMLKSLRVPKTGMAVTVDIGEPGNIHPKNKQDVGHRLAMWALGDVYGKKVAATCGPLPARHEIRDSEIVVSFTHADGGLQAKGGELTGFVIAGEDKQWKAAVAKIAGDTVIVSAADVKKPVAVRYAWAGDPVCNLYNGAGLPASPFRTDEWAFPSTGKNRK